MSKGPTYGNGKICYLEIPAQDINQSSAFYRTCFGWSIRADNSGHTSFDDTVGEVSGMWIEGQPPMREPGIIISIMVDNAAATSKLISENGGQVIKEMTLPGGEIIVHFRDPAGNFLGLYQGQ
jgi:predicted enzyme related to lactoylglutathione lyase